MNIGQYLRIRPSTPMINLRWNAAAERRRFDNPAPMEDIQQLSMLPFEGK